MTKEEILSLAKKIITEEVEKAGYKVIEIILFGSRARGDDNPDSDWDFYVIVDKNITYEKKKEILRNIRRSLVKEKIYSDIIIQSEKVVNERKDNCGYLIYYVFKEGRII